MTTALYYLAAVFVFISLAIVVIEFVGTWAIWRVARDIVCPADDRPASIGVDAVRAALPAAVGRPPRLTVQACSRWPERAGCEQKCLAQLTAHGAPA
jgi:hypothetical protein